MESVTESAREANEMQATPSTSPEMSPAAGRLIRTVGHDLKNKLGVMANSIYYLNMKLGHGDAAEGGKVSKHLRIMEREVANANRMIADLMDFALLKEPVLRRGDIKAIVAESLSQASLSDGWETAIHLGDDLPSIMADAFQLQRALTNIVLRIVKGVPTGGKLQIGARVQDGFVELRFGAAGLIIPDENLTGAAAPRASTGGTSLGLAVSKMLVEAHGGTLGAERLARDGTVFVVKLPL